MRVGAEDRGRRAVRDGRTGNEGGERLESSVRRGKRRDAGEGTEDKGRRIEERG